MKSLFNRLFLRIPVFEVENRLIGFKSLGYKSKSLEIWHENERVKDILTNMPYSNAFLDFFQAYKGDSGLNYRYLLIADIINESDNWYYRRSKTWIVTLKSVFEIIVGVLSLQNIDAEPLKRFISQEVA